MTTLTSRPLPLLPLVLPIPMTCNDRPSSAGSSPSSVSAMHPDSLLLQHHGVTSPRLSSTCSSYSKNCGTSPATMDSDQERTPRNFRLMGPSDPSDHMFGSPDGDDNTTDRMSCCSDDSELSVGQECCDNASSENSVAKSRFSSVDNKRVMDECESVDNASSLSDDNRLAVGEHLGNDDASNDSNSFRDSDPVLLSAAMRIPAPIVRPSPTRLQEELLRKSHLYAEELMKQQMQFMAAARASAFSLRHGTISPEIGKVGFRPHIKQPELTENLANFSGIHSHLNAISKISSQLTCGESALSKLTAFGVNSSSREPSQSPPSLNQIHPHHQHHHPHHHHPFLPHQFMNNNLNETNLKFSIDNILKADFGRRITDPILKRATSHHGNSSKSSHSRKAAHRNNSEKHGAPIDLTSVVPTANSINTSAVPPPAAVLEKSQHHSPGKSPNLTSPTTTASCTTTTSSQSSSTSTSSTSATSSSTTTSTENSSSGPIVWPAWVYCTRYSDRPSSGPRTRKPKKPPSEKGTSSSSDEKRPRTAFSGPQLARLKHEFTENRYLTERRRQQLSAELGLNEAQIKIWFQNKRAKIKKASGTKNPLALQLMAQGLYNHSTVPLTREEEELQELQAKGAA